MFATYFVIDKYIMNIDRIRFLPFYETTNLKVDKTN